MDGWTFYTVVYLLSLLQLCFYNSVLKVQYYAHFHAHFWFILAVCLKMFTCFNVKTNKQKKNPLIFSFCSLLQNMYYPLSEPLCFHACLFMSTKNPSLLLFVSSYRPDSVFPHQPSWCVYLSTVPGKRFPHPFWDMAEGSNCITVTSQPLRGPDSSCKGTVSEFALCVSVD